MHQKSQNEFQTEHNNYVLCYYDANTYILNYSTSCCCVVLSLIVEIKFVQCKINKRSIESTNNKKKPLYL